MEKKNEMIITNVIFKKAFIMMTLLLITVYFEKTVMKIDARKV